MFYKMLCVWTPLPLVKLSSCILIAVLKEEFLCAILLFMRNILHWCKGDVILFCFRAGYLSWLQMSRPTIGIVIVNVLNAAFQFAELRSIFTLWGKYKAKKLLPPATILLVIGSFLIIISHHDYQFVSLIFHDLKLKLQSIYSCF